MIKYLLLFLFSFSVSAKNIEVWFLREVTVAQLNLLIESKKSNDALLAFNFRDGCIPMGEGCFHPQLGMITDESKDKKKSKKDEKVETKTFNAIETDLVKCDKNYHFDMFCGKAKKINSSKNELEVWIDISSSFRTMDYSKEKGRCARRSMVEKIQASCDKVDFFLFDEGKKMMGSNESACDHYGLNNTKRIIKWMMESEAKNIFMITDINEYSMELSDYLESVGAKVVGGDNEKITSKDLSKLADIVISRCK